MTTATLLQAHINRMDNGYLNFSDVELNTRADLVRFLGYSVEEAATIDEGLAYRLIENDGSLEDEDGWEENFYGFRCKCGEKYEKIQFINGYPGRYGSDDGYLCKCVCGNEAFINECALDAYYYDEE